MARRCRRSSGTYTAPVEREEYIVYEPYEMTWRTYRNRWRGRELKMLKRLQWLVTKDNLGTDSWDRVVEKRLEIIDWGKEFFRAKYDDPIDRPERSGCKPCGYNPTPESEPMDETINLHEEWDANQPLWWGDWEPEGFWDDYDAYWNKHYGGGATGGTA